MTDLVQDQRLALEPLRRALLADALQEAERIRCRAEEEGRAAVTAAEDEVATMLAEARSRGEEEGAALRRADQARARSAARSVTLARRRADYEELRRRSLAAVGQLLRQQVNRELLAEVLRRGLGGDAAVSDSDDGGLLARAADGRVIDASVGVLVDRALAGLDLERLWNGG